MIKNCKPKVAIINYGLGNLFSVQQACRINGLEGIITSTKEEIKSADAVILPGVGAFRAAMETLKRLHLTDVIKEAIETSKPFLGVCLGMQLLMEKSYEFGKCEGLGIIEGEVVRFNNPISETGKILKIPQVGWNAIYSVENKNGNSWSNSLFQDISNHEYMYFVHSYYIKPKNQEACLSMSRYGDVEFCSSLQSGNMFACQFHPERSGHEGLKIYNKFAELIKKDKTEVLDARKP